ncbi:MAG: chitinase [Butyrivibrio sp.]|nr:chitinase [Butyrivibrio sp.]
MKKKVIPAIIIIVLIFVFAGIFVGQQFLKKYSYSEERADLDSYFGITSDTDVPIVLGNEIIEERAKLLDGTYYMDFASVQKYLNERFYYGIEDSLLIYTTPTAIITSEVGTSSYHDSTGDSGEEAYVISRLEGETLYVALDYVKKYTNFFYEGFTEPNHLQLTTSWEDETVATIAKDTQLRHRGGVKSEILEDLKKDETVVVLEELDNWTKVKSADSIIGYVENKKLKDITTKSPIPVTDYQEPEYTSLTRDHLINMGYHAIYAVSGNDTINDVLASTSSINVLCPKWFALTSSEGSIENLSSSSYVKKAHDQGIEVWALFNNIDGGDVSTSDMLRSAANRAATIENVIAATTAVGADGLNLDFELIQSSDGQSFIEFVRELSIACRAEGLVFSIDNYVPMDFNDHYDLKEQGVVADYVVIMGYDEHYSGSSEAGSVASLGYVENGIIKAAEDVDPSKIINAVPFYTRIWRTKGSELSCETVSMKMAKDFIANNSMEMTWDASAGQNYGEFTTDDGTYTQLWMEDAVSLSQKIDSMKAHNVAGIAEWCLGMETPDVWDVISGYIGG